MNIAINVMSQDRSRLQFSHRMSVILDVNLSLFNIFNAALLHCLEINTVWTVDTESAI